MRLTERACVDCGLTCDSRCSLYGKKTVAIECDDCGVDLMGCDRYSYYGDDGDLCHDCMVSRLEKDQIIRRIPGGRWEDEDGERFDDVNDLLGGLIEAGVICREAGDD